MPKHLTTNDTGDFVTSAVIGAADGIAQLGSDGKVPNSQLPTVLTGSVDSVNGLIGNVVLTSLEVGALPTAARGAVNGVAALDASSRVPTTQLPTTVVYDSVLGQPSGIATLGGDGKLTTAQVPTAPVTSVAGKTGAVTLVASDAGALATSTRGAANGVASLDSSSLVPLAQIPSLLSLYQPVPGTTPARPGQRLTAIAGGSNSAQWTDPLVYTASSSGAMPTTGVPTGALCVRTDLAALYRWTGSSWAVMVPQDPGWSTMTLPSGTQGYNGSASNYLPRYKKIGNQVWLKGRIELTSGANFTSGYSLTLPGTLWPATPIDLIAASTTSSNQIGVARWQINTDGTMVYFCGSGPNPATPWLGIVGTYMVD